jgi:hypothetical protein
MTMCIEGTPVSWHDDVSLYVKHEEECCPGGPNFSKTRGVYAHIKARPEQIIGVLDTSHSQGGWAVARACKILNRKCRLYYPVFKGRENEPLKPQQQAAADLGAEMVPLAAGRSVILYHRAKKLLGEEGYFMPNALKLAESVAETAAEVERTALPSDINAVLISASSGTIAAGVIQGLADAAVACIVHLGYSRSETEVRRYLSKMAGFAAAGDSAAIIDEGYAYADAAKGAVELPPYPCDRYYDRKAYNWHVLKGRFKYGKTLLWNIG